MSIASSNSSPSVLPAHLFEVGQLAHSVQFYGEDSFLLDELSAFIGATLVEGGSAVVIATKAHREGLIKRLQARGFDATQVIAQGRYQSLDAAQTLERFMREGWPDAAHFVKVVGTALDQAAMATQGKTPRIAAFGEMVALLWERGDAEAAIRLEQLWNDLAKTYPLALRCAYPISAFDREEHGDSFLKICAQHSHVIPVESHTMLVSEEERSRSISCLQQKAQALEAEVAERRHVEEALRKTQAQLESLVEQRTVALRQLSSSLLNLQDGERRRIARELHDSLGQYLTGLKLNVDLMQQAHGRTELLPETEQLVQQCISEVRTLSYLLHPPTIDAAGFASAASWFVEGLGQRSGIKVTLDVPSGVSRLPDSIEIALFRVLQEALTNVHRHSGASEAHVSIGAHAQEVVLEVRDNGRGISAERLANFLATGAGMGVGLAGIRERAWELGGKLSLGSDSHGTSVRVAIPVSGPAQL